MLMWFEVVAVQKLAVVLDHYAAGLALLRMGASWRAKGDWCVNPPFAALKTVLSRRQFLSIPRGIGPVLSPREPR
jgi:hypothetical protein